jgi:hypothetical protein
LFDPLVPVSEHVERALLQAPQRCWQAAVALAAASFSVLPVATSKFRVPLASAMAAHVFWNRYTTLQSLPYLLHAAMASPSAAARLVLFWEIPCPPAPTAMAPYGAGTFWLYFAHWPPQFSRHPQASLAGPILQRFVQSFRHLSNCQVVCPRAGCDVNPRAMPSKARVHPQRLLAALRSNAQTRVATGRRSSQRASHDWKSNVFIRSFNLPLPVDFSLGRPGFLEWNLRGATSTV